MEGIKNFNFDEIFSIMISSTDDREIKGLVVPRAN